MGETSNRVRDATGYQPFAATAAMTMRRHPASVAIPAIKASAEGVKRDTPGRGPHQCDTPCRGPYLSGVKRYPMPRTVVIRSAPSLRRRYPTYTSTMLDSGSNSYPHTWDSSCSRDST